MPFDDYGKCGIYSKVATILFCSSLSAASIRTFEQIQYVQLSGTVKWVHHLIAL